MFPIGPWCPFHVPHDYRRRSAAFIARARALGQRVHVHHIWQHRSRQAWTMHQLRDWLADLPAPCAMFLDHDGAANHVMSQLKRLGRLVPQDCAILAVGDDP